MADSMADSPETVIPGCINRDFMRVYLNPNHLFSADGRLDDLEIIEEEIVNE